MDLWGYSIPIFQNLYANALTRWCSMCNPAKDIKLSNAARTLDEQMWLVVVRGFGKKPLMLLTNVEVKGSRKSIWRIEEAYISRWLLEAVIRFMKQSYHLEDIRLLDRQRLKNMMGILLVVFYFLSVRLGRGCEAKSSLATSLPHPNASTE